MFIRNFVYSLIFIMTLVNTNAQVAINTTAVDASAALKIHADNKGLLLPKVNLTSTLDVTTVPNPATSLIVYNNNVVNDVILGYYYWDGAKWDLIVDTAKKYARAKYINSAASSGMDLNTSVLVPIAGTEDYNNYTSLYSNPSNTTIEITEGGRYQIVVHLYLHTKFDKVQPYCQLNINGTPKGAIAANGYINNDDFNFDSSLQIFETLSLNAGDQITLQMDSHYSGITRFKSTGTSSLTITKIK